MSQEFDKPDDISTKVRALIEDYADGWKPQLPESRSHALLLSNERSKRLKIVETEIRQLIKELGDEGLSTFYRELDKLKEKEGEKRVYGDDWRAIESVGRFLRQLQEEESLRTRVGGFKGENFAVRTDEEDPRYDIVTATPAYIERASEYIGMEVRVVGHYYHSPLGFVEDNDVTNSLFLYVGILESVTERGVTLTVKGSSFWPVGLGPEEWEKWYEEFRRKAEKNPLNWKKFFQFYRSTKSPEIGICSEGISIRMGKIDLLEI